LQQTLKTFTKIESQVSSHYLISDGKVVQMLNDYLRAWHAGAGTGENTDINSTSIGIELDNNGTEVSLNYRSTAY
jgi:N-acetylmuramoyl-L-alanine amidase